MKNLSTLLIAILFSVIGLSFAQAQDIEKYDNLEEYDKKHDERVHTLFNKEKRDGFYFSVSTGYSPIDNKDGMTFSTRGCLIMDHVFAIGFAGTGFLNNIGAIDNQIIYEDGNSESGSGAYTLAGGYGGLVLEPILFGLKPVHLSFPIVMGIGAATSFDSWYNTYYNSDESIFFVAEPMVELEINFTRFMRIAAYASYRFTSDLSIENVSSDALRNYSAGVTVKFGLF
jgi:hypothetical protein